MNAIKKFITTAGLTSCLMVAAFGTAPATAEVTAPSATIQTPAAAQWLTVKQVYDKLEAAGYREILSIERESRSYEVKATDAQGQRVKLYLEPLSGAIIETKVRRSRD